MLAALVLTLHFQPGRKVPDTDRAFRLVDVLPPCPAGPHSLPLQVLVANLDLHLVRFGQYRDGGSGRVDTPLLFSLRDALHPVAAAFVAKVLIGVVAGDTENHFLEAAVLAGAERYVL